MIWLMGIKRIIEGSNLSVICLYIVGEFIVIIVYWFKIDLVFRYDDQMLWILNIEKEDLGIYVCYVENSYSSGNRGIVNVII